MRSALLWAHIEDCYTGDLFSDHECHFRLDAQELVDPLSNSLQLVEGRDVLSLQHVPDALGQMEISNWPFTASIKTIWHPSYLLIFGKNTQLSDGFQSGRAKL